MQNNFNFGNNPGGTPGFNGQPPGGNFNFGAAQQQQQPAFGQPQQQPAQPAFASGFPPQQQQQQPAFSFGAPAVQQQAPQFAFGAAQQQQQPQPVAAASNFNFGAAPTPSPPIPVSTFGAPTAAPAAPTIGFGSPATTGAGGAVTTTFGFGQQSTAAQQQQPVSFDFGAGKPPRIGIQQQPKQQASQQKQSYVPPHQRGATTASKSTQQLDGEEEEELNYEAMKRQALANMPTFGGGASTGVTPPPPPPAPRSTGPAGGRGGGGRRGGRSGNNIAALDVDVVETGRRSQRAARFAPVSTTTTGAGGASQQTAGMDSGGEEIEDRDADGLAFRSTAAGSIVGTCEEMCPAEERRRRQNMNDIQIFERVDPQNSSLTSPELAVKRFARTIDNPVPSQFRTRGALTRTMDYLRALLDRSEVRFGMVHKFLWDRYRSVRQDLYIQGIQDHFAVAIYEEVVRFHVLCEHELCGEDQSVTDMEGFNSHLNIEQMNKSLISLNEMYIKLADAGTPAPHEAEFRAYHLLSVMGEHGKYKGDQQAFLSTLQKLRPEVRATSEIMWVLELQRAYASNNFAKFFHLVASAPYLLACMAHSYFPIVRKRALLALTEALCPKPGSPVAIELDWLQEMLMFDSLEEVFRLCEAHNLQCGQDEAGNPVVNLVKGAALDVPISAMNRTPSAMITSKALPSRGLCVTTPLGNPLSPEEMAVLEAKRQEELRRQREAEERVRRQALEARQQQLAAQKAEQEAAERAQREVAEQQQQAELERQRQEQARAVEEQCKVEEAARQAELQRQAEAQRLAEIEAERQRQEAAARAAEEAQRRAAAEAEARRVEAERLRREAEERERQRLAELERQRLEELHRQEEERKRKLEEARIRAVQRRFLAFWIVGTRQRLAGKRRKEKAAASLKACRVGVVPNRALLPEEELEAVEYGLHDLDLGAGITGTASGGATPTKGGANASGAGMEDGVADILSSTAHQQQQGIDLPALVAPLVSQRSPDSKTLLWKIGIIPAVSSTRGGGTRVQQQQQQQHLGDNPFLNWLQVQLCSGSNSSVVGGSAFVQGPASVTTIESNEQGVGKGAELTTCVTLPPPLTLQQQQGDGQLLLSQCGAVLAGASGIIIAADSANTTTQQQQAVVDTLIEAIPSSGEGAERVPVLIVTDSDDTARAWQQSPALSHLLAFKLGGGTDASAQQQRFAVKILSLAVDSTIQDLGVGAAAEEPTTAASLTTRLVAPLTSPSQLGLPPGVLLSIEPSKTKLVQGIRWLAVNTPAQPVLMVTALENLIRDSVSTTMKPLLEQEQHFFDSQAAGTASNKKTLAQQAIAAFDQTMTLVEQTVMSSFTTAVAQWKWPPAEICAEPLKKWYTTTARKPLLQAIEGVKLDASAALVLPLDCSVQDVITELHLRIAALSPCASMELEGQQQQPPKEALPLVVLTPDNFHTFKTQIQHVVEAYTVGRYPELPMLDDGSDRRKRSPSPVGQKRKWRQSPSSAAQIGRVNAITVAADEAHQRLKTGLAALQQQVDNEHNNDVHFRTSLIEIARGEDGGGVEGVANVGSVEEETQGGEVENRGGPAVLQQLNQQLAKEKAASESLWTRMCNAAASLF